MSAKRLKVEGDPPPQTGGGGRTRRHDGLPIPSFSSTAVALADEEVPKPSNSQPKTLAVPLKLNWGKEDLIRVEAGLELHHFRNAAASAAGGSSISSAGGRVVNPQQRSETADKEDETGTILGEAISFDAFYALKDKLALQKSSSSSESNNGRGGDPSLDDLSDPELLLLDFLCVAAPSLYRIRRRAPRRSRGRRRSSFGDVDDDLKMPAPEGGDEVVTEAKEGEGKQLGAARPLHPDADDGHPRSFLLERVALPPGKSRMAEFRSLLSSSNKRDRDDDDSAPSLVVEGRHRDAVLEALREHRSCRRKEEESRKSGSNKTDNKTTNDQGGQNQCEKSEPVILPGMTVEERVRARAEAKREWRDRVEDANSKKQGTLASADRTWLLRVADALWHHSSTVLSNQRRFASPRRRMNRSMRFDMTIRDAVMTLRRSLSKSSSMASFSGGESTTVSKREIANALQELEEIAPEWIRIEVDGSAGGDFASSSSTGAKAKRKMLPKTACMTIFHQQYGLARSRLSGQDPPTEKEKKTSLLLERSSDGNNNRKRALPFGQTTTSSSSNSHTTPMPPLLPIVSASAAGNSGSVSSDAPLKNTAVAEARPASVTQRSLYTTPLESTKRPLKHLLSKIVTSDDQGTHQATIETASTSGTVASKRPRIAVDSASQQHLPKHGNHSAAAATPPAKLLASPSGIQTPRGSGNSKISIRSPLRINPHLILSDADRTGGEIIMPANFESPRGLKTIFNKMNAGERI